MIEKRDSHQGFDFMCTASDSGYRCGYVRIPEGHPLFGLGYTDPAPGISWEDLKGEMFGKRGFLSVLVANERESPSLRLVFDVHGSLTFSDRFRGDGPPGWWIGFDCAHAGDDNDVHIMSESFRKIYEKFGTHGGIVRTTEYVETECRSLVDQILRWFPNHDGFQTKEAK